MMFGYFRSLLVLTVLTVLVLGFVFPAVVFTAAVAILKFGAGYFCLDLACRIVFHKSIVTIIKSELKDNENKTDD